MTVKQLTPIDAIERNVTINTPQRRTDAQKASKQRRADEKAAKRAKTAQQAASALQAALR